MKRILLNAALLGMGLGIAGGSALAQQKPDVGKREYDANCASCHGPAGKGDGPVKPYLTKSAPDLTMLAKNNGGVMPVAKLYATIEGSREATAHGTAEMPVWGYEYRVQAAQHYMDTPYDPEVYVRTRILALIDYIYRLQAK